MKVLMKIAKGIAFLCLLAMTIILIFAFTIGDFGRDGTVILQNPWGLVSLVDLYTGFFLFSIWIAFREKELWKKIVWIALMMVLGFWTGALYTLIALVKADGNWERFWLGCRYSGTN